MEKVSQKNSIFRGKQKTPKEQTKVRNMIPAKDAAQDLMVEYHGKTRGNSGCGYSQDTGIGLDNLAEDIDIFRTHHRKEMALHRHCPNEPGLRMLMA